MSEIVFVCHSTNNKNVRDGELVILRKFEDGLYFEFGENEKNIKKRFYNDLETLNQDFDALLRLKENKKQEPKIEEPKEEIKVEEPIEEIEKEEIPEIVSNEVSEVEGNVNVDENEKSTLVEKPRKKKSLF